MRPKSLRLAAAAAVALGLAAVSDARAAVFRNSFDETAKVSVAIGGTSVPTASAAASSVAMGDTTITMTGLDSSGLSAAGVGTDEVIGKVLLSKTGVGTTPVQLDYAFRLAVNDNNEGASKFVDITGSLHGTITRSENGRISTLIENDYTQPSEYRLTIGNTIYKIEARYFTPPGPSTEGVFGVHVSAFPNPAPVPEPATLALWAVGGLVALALRRRLRARA